jgi:6-phosphofructokinase 2
MVVTLTLNPSLDEWVRVPRLRLGELNRATQYVRYPGGKGINVSRVVHELGGKTLAVALAGGSDGEILGDLLARYDIPYRFVTVPGSTRNNYQLQSDSPQRLTQINCPGPRVRANTLNRLEQLLCRVAARASCAVLSGSLPPGAPSTTYQRVIRRLHHLGVRTVLDASGSALLHGLQAKPWLMKPNRQEAEELLGRHLRRIADVAHAAKRLVARGPLLAIISLAADGAVLASKMHAQVLWAKPPKIPVDSAVGAGDALVAGFVSGYRARRSVGEALRLGVACGAASAMTPGTELCHRADVERVLPRVTIQVL